jgi:2-furoyl-CoA dehydrogenase FAD binding subunit
VKPARLSYLRAGRWPGAALASSEGRCRMIAADSPGAAAVDADGAARAVVDIMPIAQGVAFEGDAIRSVLRCVRHVAHGRSLRRCAAGAGLPWVGHGRPARAARCAAAALADPSAEIPLMLVALNGDQLSSARANARHADSFFTG